MNPSDCEFNVEKFYTNIVPVYNANIYTIVSIYLSK